MSPADVKENRIEDGNLPAGAVPQQKTPSHLNGFQPPRQFPGNAAYEAADSRNIVARDELARLMRWWLPAPFSQKEFAMRNRILAIAAVAGAVAGALAAPVAAQAQSTVGVVRGGSV